MFKILHPPSPDVSLVALSKCVNGKSGSVRACDWFIWGCGATGLQSGVCQLSGVSEQLSLELAWVSLVGE